jgi:hypothetical protein
MQSEGIFLEENCGRRPPPSTPSPCLAWLFRLRSPFFSPERNSRPEPTRSTSITGARSTPFETPQDVQPNAPFLPVSPSPASQAIREFPRQVLPAPSAPQNPMDPISPAQHKWYRKPLSNPMSYSIHGGSRSTDDRPVVVWAACGARAQFSPIALRSAIDQIAPSALLRRYRPCSSSIHANPHKTAVPNRQQP